MLTAQLAALKERLVTYARFVEEMIGKSKAARAGGGGGGWRSS